MNKTKILNLLGLATRARKVISGQDFVLAELSKNPNNLLFIASDSGTNISEKIEKKAKSFPVILIKDFTAEELSKAVGKENRKLLLVTDKGFIDKFIEYLDS